MFTQVDVITMFTQVDFIKPWMFTQVDVYKNHQCLHK